MPKHHDDAPTQAADVFWDELYSERDRIWSGNVNQAMADVVADLPIRPEDADGPLRALDLGCGEGGDAIWLARAGWDTVGIDISAVAVERARQAAESHGLEQQVGFRTADLTTWDEAQWASLGDFNLITASFLLSPVEFAREDVLRRAAERLHPDGHLVVVTHGSAPPWSQHQDDDEASEVPDGDDEPGHGHHSHAHDEPLATVESELAALDVDPQRWETLLAEVRLRDAVGPNGERATLDDVVVVLRRR